MSDQEIIEQHKILDSILHVNDGFMWQDVLRAFGGFIVSSLSWFNRIIETIVTKFITLNDFYKTGAVGEFMDKARPFIWVVFFVALVVLGFQFMFNKIEKRNEVLLNIVMALCFIVIIPDLMSNIQKIVGAGIEEIKPKNESLANNMIKSNVADLLYYAEKNFEFANGTSRGDANTPPRPFNKENNTGTPDYTYANRFSATSNLNIPYTQKLDLHEDDGWIFKADWVKGLSSSTKEVLKHKSVPTGVGNGYQVEELAKNKIRGTEIGRETYYRYHVNWFTLIITLLITNLALAITAIKIGRSIFDLAFHQIFGVFIAASDLTGGQRTKKVFVEIVNTFVVMVVMIALLQLFILFTTWANSWRYEIGTLGVIILLIAGAWALIDAPDIVQRQLGIDAGLRNGWQAMMGAYAASKVASGGAKAIGDAAKKTVSTGAGGVNFMRRMAEGMRTPTPMENKQREKNNVPNMPGNQSATGVGQDRAHQGIQTTAPIPTDVPASTDISNGEKISSGIAQNESAQSETATNPAATKQQGTQGVVAPSQLEQKAQKRNQGANASIGITEKHTNNKPQSSSPPLSQRSQGLQGEVKQQAIPVRENTAPSNSEEQQIPTSGPDITMGQKIAAEQGATVQANSQQNVAPIPTSSAPTMEQGVVETAAVQEQSTQAHSPQMPLGNAIAQPATQGQKAMNIEAPSTTAHMTENKGKQPEKTNIPANEKPVTKGNQQTIAENQAKTTQTQINQVASPVQQTQQATEAGRGSANQTERQNRHQQHMTKRASNQQSPIEQGQSNENSQASQAAYGHRQAVHTNTILGGNRHVQELKEHVTRAGNSGFSLGQNIRRATKFMTPSKKSSKTNEDGGNK
ncbi:hypothetical protein P9B03_02100 [Metasolibacillus meyeri]|uniref:DUF8208 domain-containing protein n=1 Tax=Metasolibacillus meyeri TaxID=1071052 RepID=A0AAW9NST1_9BACL|nr:hypothetical protein [Metasolibacillus meyeri]MEC1177263.1 hypothetical protein [Metasolibacillus meyeri]